MRQVLYNISPFNILRLDWCRLFTAQTVTGVPVSAYTGTRLCTAPLFMKIKLTMSLICAMLEQLYYLCSLRDLQVSSVFLLLLFLFIVFRLDW